MGILLPVVPALRGVGFVVFWAMFFAVAVLLGQDLSGGPKIRWNGMIFCCLKIEIYTVKNGIYTVKIGDGCGK